MSSLLIVDRYMPHNGGSRRYYHNLALQLGDVAVLTGFQPGWREFDAHAGVKVVRRPGIRPNYASRAADVANPYLNFLLAYVPGMAAVLWWTLVEMLRRRPAVVHAGGYAFAGFAARVLCPLLRVPYIVYAHGEDVMSTSRRRFFSRYMTWVLRGAAAVMVNSRNTERLVLGCGVPPGRIRLARPGVDQRWFADAASGADLAHGLLDPWPAGPVMLTVGRLVPHKGHATVMSAMPELLRRHPGLTWVLVGKGPMETELRTAAADLGLGGAVRFLSDLDDDRLTALFHAADLFVQPNGEVNGAIEGYGMVFLEAGAANLAVVGGRSGGVPEVVRHGFNGMLVPPFTVDALVSTLDDLLVNPDRRRTLGRNGRRQAEASTWARTLAGAVDLDHQLAGKAAS